MYTLLGIFVGGLVGAVVVPKQQGDYGSISQALGIIFFGAVGAAFGFGFGVSALSSGTHVVQKIKII